MRANRSYFQIQDLYPHLKHPEKYVGSRPVTMRSGWEITFVQKFLDVNPSVLQWSSESIVIQYFYPVDGRFHRYFPDFWMKSKMEDGTIKEFIIEIKPAGECEMPKVPKRQTKRYLDAVQTYIKNQEKWKAAKSYCAEQTKVGTSTQFIVITEKDLPV